jgi:hypothetical protein
MTIDTLIKLGKSEGMQHRQFIFIMPQDVSHVVADDMLKILKMTPPARNNAAGAPSQQTLNFSQGH